MTAAPAALGRARRLALEEVDSTNSIAMEAARAGDPGQLWVTALRQTQGRGRRGRSWVSERGNLYASLLLVDAAPLSCLGQLPLVIALGLARALAGLRGIEPEAVRIKWPNDILLDGRKCVGILIESERLPDGRQAVVIGAGINVAAAPDGQPYGVTTLADNGFKGNLEDVFRAIAIEVEAALALWRGGRGFADVRAGWLERARGLGQAIRVNLPDRSIDGIFHALDTEGRLVLKRDDGALEAHSAGDVFLLGEDTAGVICDKAR